MHVLIATDGSDDAVEAARQALPLLATADIVSLVYVMEPPAAATAGLESGFAGGVESPELVDAAWAEAQTEAGRALERTAEALGEPSSIDRVTAAGSPGPVICDLAASRSVDVVVVGSRGRGAFKRALLGSVSTHVVHNAPCAVLVVRSASG